jgi:GTPase SAR1 family protein
MGRYAQFVIGPAGSGKSTYCVEMQKYFEIRGRRAYVINLDPAVDTMDYEADIDLRELISVDDVMEQLEYGPNGALVFCMEYLTSNMDWLRVRVVVLDCCRRHCVGRLSWIRQAHAAALTHRATAAIATRLSDCSSSSRQEKLDEYPEDEVYFLVDCPGQIELCVRAPPKC